uniref:Uncharacterized protein n=1 Tax=Octactis speculum TaxID=3111310 RepID=A0A7S2AV48_9STRA
MELLSTQQQQLQEVLDEGYKTLQRELSTTQEAPDQRGDSVSLIVDNMVSTVCIRSMGDFSAVQNKLEMALASKAEMSEVLRLFKAEVEEIREFSITERGLMHSIVAKSGSPEECIHLGDPGEDESGGCEKVRAAQKREEELQSVLKLCESATAQAMAEKQVQMEKRRQAETTSEIKSAEARRLQQALSAQVDENMKTKAKASAALHDLQKALSDV